MRIVFFVALFCPALLFGQTVKDRLAEMTSNIFGESIKKPQAGDMISVRLKPGHISAYLNITEKRDVVGQLITKDDYSLGTEQPIVTEYIRVKVVGGMVDHLDIPIGQTAPIIGFPSRIDIRNRQALVLTSTSTKPPLAPPVDTAPPNSPLRLKETVIVFNKEGDPEFAGRVQDRSSNWEGFAPYRDLDIQIPTTLTRAPKKNIISQAMTDIDVAYNFRFSNQMNALAKFFGGDQPCIEVTPLPLGGPEISIPIKDSRIVGWDKFLADVEGMLGACLQGDPALYGTAVLNHEQALIAEFDRKMKREKNIPEEGARVDPKKIAAADVCMRTCFGEMTAEPCFDPIYFKAVVGTLKNRSNRLRSFDQQYVADVQKVVDKEVAEATQKLGEAEQGPAIEKIRAKYAPYLKLDYSNRYDAYLNSGIPYRGHFSTGFMPRRNHPSSGDEKPFAGLDPSAMNLMKDPLLEVSILGRQYNNWKMGDTFRKSMCPESKTDNYAMGKRYCSKYCAQASFRPNEFQESLGPFTKTIFSSDPPNCWDVGIDAPDSTRPQCSEQGDCLPMDRPSNGRGASTSVLIRNDKGKNVNVFKKQCTRFWRSEGVEGSKCADK